MITGLLILAFMVATILVPAPAWAQSDDPAAYAEQAIAPAVVAQGEFAARLAEALALEFAEDDEADAIRALVALGIEPAAGWQPDQAMTPLNVTELRADLVEAVAAGRLSMEADAARTAFDELLADLGLPLPVEPAPGYAGLGPPLNGYGPYCDARATEYFYSSYGLPLYSYCYPPVAYLPYYAWVPGGFYAHGHYYPGFFMHQQVHALPRAHNYRRAGHRFHGSEHKHVYKPERRFIRVSPPAPGVHDTQSAISRMQSNAMQRKSEIMQMLPPAVPPRAEPVRPATGRIIRFGGRVKAGPPRAPAPTTHAQPVSRTDHTIVPRTAPGAATQQPSRQPHPAAVSGSQRSASSFSDSRAPAPGITSGGGFGLR